MAGAEPLLGWILHLPCKKDAGMEEENKRIEKLIRRISESIDFEQNGAEELGLEELDFVTAAGDAGRSFEDFWERLRQEKE